MNLSKLSISEDPSRTSLGIISFCIAHTYSNTEWIAIKENNFCLHSQNTLHHIILSCDSKSVIYNGQKSK